MGLILGILFAIATLIGSWFLLMAESMQDIRGDQTPWLTITCFCIGASITFLCFNAHFEFIKW
ncbi:hypothetical protein IC762_12085 [Bradyrhizobium genosp. L]|uniref:hypothetical protein n=1 Tax=Bradyrhizobium genosp. L TaxID=83637 RepID=UPI0018A32227|nr:hypothetical protein [Bradyrhizobium genosp. L]QPF86983.1 hypothetical protein IC762_12085 [Bradyrhizobium genosp. L]